MFFFIHCMSISRVLSKLAAVHRVGTSKETAEATKRDGKLASHSTEYSAEQTLF